jgi:predicted nuclease with TOPRIM domain
MAERSVVESDISTIQLVAKEVNADTASKSAETARVASEYTTSLSTPAPPSDVKLDNVLEEFRKLKDGTSPVNVAKLQVLLKDYDSLREKVGKLKSLLGRSAKAQREAKVELDATQKRLDASLREIERLNKRIDKLANRPTHMELLADFEANFDRALLQLAPTVTGSAGYHQEGGEGTASPAAAAPAIAHDDTVISGLLLQELADYKQRIEKLESLNGALVNRSAQLESEVFERKHERDELLTKLSHMELEKRMAVLEAEQATKAMHDTEVSLKEMQMEIDLVTKASVTANVRAAHGEQLVKAVKTDKQHVQKLEAQVQALQEWALASSEAKTLAQERIRLLEAQLHSEQQEKGSGSTSSSGQPASASERILFSKGASMVVGAGDVAAKVLSLTEEQCRSVRLSERVVLRWQFDLTQDDATIDFSIAQADCGTLFKRKNARYLVENRLITGGAAGETENAFAVENACTLVWSNAKAWIRPKTVKYSVEAVVVPY